MNTQLLKDLCTVYGPSGYESLVADAILKDLKNYIDSHEIDALGNLICHKKGSGRKMMLAGHMDQLGLLVTDISKEGFLYFTSIGGNPPPNLKTQRVIFKNGTVLNSGDNRFNNQNKIIGNPIVNKGGTAMKIHTPLSLQ